MGTGEKGRRGGHTIPPQDRGTLPAMGSSNSPPPSATEYRIQGDGVTPMAEEPLPPQEPLPGKHSSNTIPGALQ